MIATVRGHFSELDGIIAGGGMLVGEEVKIRVDISPVRWPD